MSAVRKQGPGVARRWSAMVLLAVVCGGAVGYAQSRSSESPPDVAALIERLQAPTASARAAAACEIGRLGHRSELPVAPLVAVLDDDRPTPAVRCRLERQMGRWARDFAGRELDTSEWPPTSPAREAARSLVRGNEDIVVPVLDALGAPDPTARKYAAWILGRREEARAVGPLVGRLGDDDPTVRAYVVEALGRLEDPTAVRPLTSGLTDPDARVREESAIALGRLAATAAVPALVDALRDADADVRVEAVRALGRIRDPQPVAALALLVDDQDAEISEAAVRALGRIPGEPATTALLEAVDHEDPHIREHAIDALGTRR